jgi:hypothetical protein
VSNRTPEGRAVIWLDDLFERYHKGAEIDLKEELDMPSKDRDARGFRLWHEADIKLRPLFGRYGVESGRHRLIVQNHARSMAFEAELVRGVYEGSDHQP